MPNFRRRLPPLAPLIGFEAAARLGNFSRAAAELHLTQAALSRQIKTLEQNLGLALFERRRYDVKLTLEGEALAAAVTPLLRSLADVADELRAASRGGQSLTVFADTTLAGAFLIPRLGDFGRQHPELSLHIISSNQPVEDCLQPFDIGLQTGIWAPDRFVIVPVSEDEIFPVCSPGYGRRFAGAVKLADLADAALLHLEQPDRPWTDWRAFFNAFGYRAALGRSRLSFNNYPNLLDAAEQGLGLALGWKTSVEDRLRKGTLVRCGDYAMPVKHGICAYLPNNRQPQPITQQFIDWLTVQAGK